jgi:hypothetical protein
MFFYTLISSIVFVLFFLLGVLNILWVQKLSFSSCISHQTLFAGMVKVKVTHLRKGSHMTHRSFWFLSHPFTSLVLLVLISYR